MVKKIIIITILVALLIAVRIFQYDLFYDPFLLYFKNSYLSNSGLPEFSWIKMTAFLFLRYTINTIISLAIIYTLFKNKDLLKFSIATYAISFLVLIPIYYYYINIEFEGGYLAAFYVRRFLIQPLLLFLLVPAFFYQQKVLEKEA
jgi:exosortase F-associated protein